MVENRKILVTGSNGQLGSCLRELAVGSRHEFIFTDVTELDIKSTKAVRLMIQDKRPDWVVNCAAYTAVDKAQSDAEQAELLNATAVGILATQAQSVGAGIVHISTDYVFRGDNAEPRREDDATVPRSVYGITKLKGERLAAQNPKHIILRTGWLYSVYGHNFVKTMRRLGSDKAQVDVVADQWGSPTSANDLAVAILTVIENPVYGTYHFSNEGVTNWALFAEQIFELSGINCRVNHISTSQYPTAAERPQYSLLSKEKFKSIFGVEIPEWEMSLEKVIERLKSEQMPGQKPLKQTPNE